MESHERDVQYRVVFRIYCRYSMLEFVWDEARCRSNLEKHGLDFQNAYLVYDNPEKCTFESSRQGESRWLDLELAVLHGRELALVYTHRGGHVRIISFRSASREEREIYEQESR